MTDLLGARFTDPLEGVRLSAHLSRKLGLPPELTKAKLWDLPVDAMREEKILEALDQVEFLTVRLAGRLFYAVRRDGSAAAPARARPSTSSSREYDQGPGYWSAKYMMNAMAKRKVRAANGRMVPLLVKRKADDKKHPDIYHRPDAKIRDSLTYDHDMSSVVSFVLLHLSGQLDAFQRFWNLEQWEFYCRDWKLEPDAVLALLPTPDYMHFQEIDNGTEWDKGQIREKCQVYVDFFDAHSDVRGSVHFATRGYRGETDEQRMGKMLEVFAEFRRQNMFLVTTLKEYVGDHKLLDGNPLGRIFRSPWPKPDNPLDPAHISLLDLR